MYNESFARIMSKAHEFASDDVARMYIAVAVAWEWQKETGGTLGELLEEMDRMYAKKELSRRA